MRTPTSTRRPGALPAAAAAGVCTYELSAIAIFDSHSKIAITAIKVQFATISTIFLGYLEEKAVGNDIFNRHLGLFRQIGRKLINISLFLCLKLSFRYRYELPCPSLVS